MTAAVADTAAVAGTAAAAVGTAVAVAGAAAVAVATGTRTANGTVGTHMRRGNEADTSPLVVRVDDTSACPARARGRRTIRRMT